MNNKTIIEFSFHIISRIMKISEGVIWQGPRQITPSSISIARPGFQNSRLKNIWAPKAKKYPKTKTSRPTKIASEIGKHFFETHLFARNYYTPLTLYQNESELGGSWMVTKIHTSCFWCPHVDKLFLYKRCVCNFKLLHPTTWERLYLSHHVVWHLIVTPAVQIPHPTQAKVKFPTPTGVQVMVKSQGVCLREMLRFWIYWLVHNRPCHGFKGTLIHR